ncbi:MAG: SusC/RagA family TonB-linked outer membrane protein [Mangrovibacterium sp.]
MTVTILLLLIQVNVSVSSQAKLLNQNGDPISINTIGKSQIVQHQQPASVSGKVTDSSGNPVPGVTVVLKSTAQGTVTNDEGKFSLSNIPANAILRFSFVGLKNQEIEVAGKTVINVVMEEETVGLEEVVAIGYGTMKKVDMTGAAGSVSGTEIIKAPVKSFDEAMAGRVAGVQISSDDGQPGSLPNIVIRGQNSITQDNSPLYVVDGIPLEDNDNNSINPADIQSIDILKDASATAIYGARGANGVIMITTKRGQVGDPVISYDGYFGYQKDIKRIETMSPYEFVKLQLERSSYDTENQYLSGRGKTLEDYKNVAGINWYDKVIQTAPVQNHSISVSGGTSKSRYSVSGSYMGQEGIFLETGFKRYQGRATLDQDLTKKLKTGLTVNYSSTSDYGPVASSGSGSASLMYSIWSYRPVFPNSTGEEEYEVVDPSINPTEDYRTNPLLQLEHELREKLSSNLMANAYVEYSISKQLKLRVTGGFNKNTYQRNEFNNSKTRTGNPQSPQYKGINGSETFSNGQTLTNENTLTWTKTINKDHHLNLVGGFTQQQGKSSSFGTTVVMISDESLGLNGLDTGSPTVVVSSGSYWVLHSFIGRLNYNYKSKYLLTASIRADGSSKFSKENRWGYFPSAALAYRISSENFMKSLRAVSDAKIRISYGATGNNRVGDFSRYSGITTDAYSGYPFGNTAASRGTYPGTLGNSDLKWETTKQFNTGIDLSFFKNRLSLTGDYYNKKTEDLLLNASMPYTSGYNSAYKNIGSVSNRGVEFSINTVNINRSDFKWSSNFNISFNRNKVLALTEGQEALTTIVSGYFGAYYPTYIAKVGKPMAMFYGLVFDGLYGYDDFGQMTNGTYILKDNIPNNGLTNRASIAPGHVKYRDINNDLQINTNDFTIIGDPNPDFVGGLSNNFEYKGFDLSVLLQFSYGNDVLNANRMPFEGGAYTAYNTNAYASYTNRWTEENPTGDIPRVGGYGGNNLYSSRFIEDGSFLRLKTLSFGYSFGNEILAPLHIKTLRLYMSAQNLFTLTGYSGIDPEVSTRNSALTPGFDYSPYPRMKTMTVGLNVVF